MELNGIKLYKKVEHDGESTKDFQKIYLNMKKFYLKHRLVNRIHVKNVDTIIFPGDKTRWMPNEASGMSMGNIRTIFLKNYYSDEYEDEYGKSYPGFTNEVFIHEIGHQFFRYGIEKSFNIDEDFENEDFAYENFNESISYFVENINFDEDEPYRYEISLYLLENISFNNLDISSYIKKMYKYNYNQISIDTFSLLYFYMIKKYGYEILESYIKETMRTGSIKKGIHKSTGEDIEILSEEFHKWVRGLRRKAMYKEKWKIYLSMPTT